MSFDLNNLMVTSREENQESIDCILDPDCVKTKWHKPTKAPARRPLPVVHDKLESLFETPGARQQPRPEKESVFDFPEPKRAADCEPGTLAFYTPKCEHVYNAHEKVMKQATRRW